jgi:hypothetical protein
MTQSIVSTTDSPEAVIAAMGDLAKPEPVEEKTEVSTEVEAKSEEKEVAEIEEEISEESEEEEASEDVEEKDETKPKKKGGFQKKLERKDKQISSLEQEREYWRKEALRTKEAVKEEVIEVKPDLSKKPKAETFATHDDYVEALTDWKLDQKLLANERKQNEDKVKSETKSKIDKHQARVAEFKVTQNDWDDVIEEVANAPLSITVQEAIINSDHGPEMMYELAKEPKELRRICALSPIQAAMALGKIEARFSKSTESSEKKILTKAPAPIKTVRSKATTSSSGYREDMSLKEYEKWRIDQQRSRV